MIENKLEEHVQNNFFSRPLSPLSPEFLRAGLCFPFWLARLILTTPIHAAGNQDSFDLSRLQGLLPALFFEELEALALIVGSLQEQLITQTSQTRKPISSLQLSSQEILRLSSLKDPRKRQRLARVIQLVPFLSFSNNGSEKNRFATYPLFQPKIEHFISEDSPSSTQLVVYPQAYTVELLLGYADQYQNLRRVACGDISALETAPLLKQDPLFVGRSLWLELTDQEKKILLKVEKAKIWDLNWLHLDGVVGVDLQEILEEFISVESLQTDPEIGFEVVYRSLERLGSKLVSHGYTKPQVTGSQLLLGESLHKLLCWQLSSRLVDFSPSAEYLASAAKILKLHLCTKAFSDFYPLWSWGNHEQSLQEVFHGWRSSFSMEQQQNDSFFNLGEGRLVFTEYLAVEWLLRSRPGHRYPLPKNFLKNMGFEGLPPGRISGEAFGAYFSKALDWINSHHKLLLEELKSGDQVLYLAHPHMLKDSGFLEEMRLLFQAADVTPSVVSAPKTNEELSSPLAPAVVATPPSLPKLLHVAESELKRMIQTDPSAYQELKEQYLSSLAPSARQLIFEIEKKMKPKVFEEHLKQRLVRYMVEHPLHWKSAKTSELL